MDLSFHEFQVDEIGQIEGDNMYPACNIDGQILTKVIDEESFQNILKPCNFRLMKLDKLMKIMSFFLAILMNRF